MQIPDFKTFVQIARIERGDRTAVVWKSKESKIIQQELNTLLLAVSSEISSENGQFVKKFGVDCER